MSHESYSLGLRRRDTDLLVDCPKGQVKAYDIDLR